MLNRGKMAARRPPDVGEQVAKQPENFLTVNYEHLVAGELSCKESTGCVCMCVCDTRRFTVCASLHEQTHATRHTRRFSSDARLYPRADPSKFRRSAQSLNAA